MKVLKPLRKGTNKAIVSLTKIYGLDAKIYKPLEIEDLQHGFSSNNIKWDRENSIEQRILIPYYFKTQQSSFSVFDPLYKANEIIMYLVADLDYPKYSLINIITPKGTPASFIIDNKLEIKDDEVVIFRKYKLVPHLTLDTDEFRDNYKLNRDKQIEQPLNSIINKKPKDNPEENNNTLWQYKPIS